MEIKIYKPSPLLEGFIKYYWTLENGNSDYSQLVYPTGEIQMLFHFGRPFKETGKDQEPFIQPEYFICGQKTSFFESTAFNGASLIAVVFQSYSPAVIIPFSLCEITNKIIEIEDLFPDWRREKEKCINAKAISEKIRVIEEYLIKKIHPCSSQNYELIKFCIEDIKKYNGKMTIDSIVKKYNLSGRTLERMFNKYVGLNPKKYCDIIKAENAIRLFKTDLSAAQICYQAGYYDQSHFTKTIKEYTGCTPSQLKQFI